MTSSLARLSASLAVSTIMMASVAFAQTPSPETPPAGAPVVQPEPKPFVYTPKEDDIVVGVPSAKVTLVEYASLSCPHCAHFHNDVLPELKKKYIDFGNLRVVFRHFPLNGSALSGAITVNCVPTNERQKYLKVLFATQDKWAFDSNYKDAISNIVNVGGLTKERFEACQNDKKIEESIILVRKEAGEMSWVNSTPTFFINGKKFEGEKTIEDFSKAIDPFLK